MGMNIKELLAQMGFGEQAVATTFQCEEDGEDYNVWKIEEDTASYVLKKTSERELAVYDTFLQSAEYRAPRFYKSLSYCEICIGKKGNCKGWAMALRKACGIGKSEGTI